MEKLIKECVLEIADKMCPWRTEGNLTEDERRILYLVEAPQLLIKQLAVKLQEKGVIIPPTQEEANNKAIVYTHFECPSDFDPQLCNVEIMVEMAFLAGYNFATTTR